MRTDIPSYFLRFLRKKKKFNPNQQNGQPQQQRPQNGNLPQEQQRPAPKPKFEFEGTVRATVYWKSCRTDMASCVLLITII